MSTAPNQASSAPDKSNRTPRLIDLHTAQRMLPLVRAIVAELVDHFHSIEKLSAERDRLDRHRRDLVWQERQRRYHVHEELTRREAAQTLALAELEALGIRLLNPNTGEIGFPMTVNNQPAYFSWQNGDDSVSHWHYADESNRRPIPADWAKHGSSVKYAARR